MLLLFRKDRQWELNSQNTHMPHIINSIRFQKMMFSSKYTILFLYLNYMYLAGAPAGGSYALEAMWS